MESVRRIAALDKVGNKIFRYETKNPVKYLTFITGLFERHGRVRRPGPPGDLRLHRLGRPDRAADPDRRGPLHRRELRALVRPLPLRKARPRPAVLADDRRPQPRLLRRSSTSCPGPRTAASSPIRTAPSSSSATANTTIAHEIAHQWWGQAVTWDRYRDQWLSEGVAQFAAARYIREKQGERAYTAILKRFSQTDRAGLRLRADHPRLAHQLPGFQRLSGRRLQQGGRSPSRCSPTSSARTPSSAACAISRNPSGSAPARTANFIRSHGARFGRDLGPFFRGWFDSHLLPDVRVRPRGPQAGRRVHPEAPGRPGTGPSSSFRCGSPGRRTARRSGG